MDLAADAGRHHEATVSIYRGRVAVKDFDVFLCYNSDDRLAVGSIAERLKRNFINPWIDYERCQPGIPWLKVLEEDHEHLRALAVFIDPSGISPWQFEEFAALFERFKERPIIPVLLPGAPNPQSVPLPLSARTRVDFGQDPRQALRDLIWDITGERRTLIEPDTP